MNPDYPLWDTVRLMVLSQRVPRPCGGAAGLAAAVAAVLGLTQVAVAGGALNPVESVWQFIRHNWLSNRVFDSYDDIVARCCVARNKLTDLPWRMLSLGLRDWAHGF